MAKAVARPESDLVARIRTIVAGPRVTEQRMFGGTCFMLDGNMVAGTLRGELLVRVGKDANDAALRRPHARRMEMARPAPGYVIVDAEGTRRDRDLKAWIDSGLAFVETLPPKKKAPPKVKAASRKKVRST